MSSMRPTFRLPILVVLVLSSLLFALISADVLHRGFLTRLDQSIAAALHQFTGRWGGADILAASAVSGLGEYKVLLAVVLVSGLLMSVRRCWRGLSLLLIGVVGSAVINPLVKVIFAIPRPVRFTPYVWDEPHPGYSYPSGHTMGVAVTAGLLALILPGVFPLLARRRSLLILLAVFLACLEAAALVYIGVHYLTDVLAALSLSLLWLSFLVTLLPPSKPTAAAESPRPLTSSS